MSQYSDYLEMVLDELLEDLGGNVEKFCADLTELKDRKKKEEEKKRNSWDSYETGVTIASRYRNKFGDYALETQTINKVTSLDCSVPGQITIKYNPDNGNVVSYFSSDSLKQRVNCDKKCGIGI